MLPQDRSRQPDVGECGLSPGVCQTTLHGPSTREVSCTSLRQSYVTRARCASDVHGNGSRMTTHET